MSSVLAWLDFSDDEQRRAGELLRFFSEREARDELGIGTIRDAFSDALFPGTSVIQTRARYFLFVPWLFQEAQRRGYAGPDLLSRVGRYERRLVEALRRGGWGETGQGLIGRVAGAQVKNLPSAIYWTGLQRFGILRVPATREQVATTGTRAASFEEALTELADRPGHLWDPNLPGPPDGFFQMAEASFELSPEEAEWLAERIEATTEGTLLAWLAASQAEMTADSTAPWDDPATTRAPEAIQRVIGHARYFSAVMHAAALLYNLLLAERAQEQGLGTGELAGQYRDQLEEWAESDEIAAGLAGWDVGDFWDHAISANPRIPPRTRGFVDRWIELALAGRHDIAGDERARHLVAAREQWLKSPHSRFTNDRLLREWRGSSGTRRLAFRWPQVKVLLGDIEQGRSAVAGA
jgi:Family of unknown function (DUF6361)